MSSVWTFFYLWTVQLVPDILSLDDLVIFPIFLSLTRYRSMYATCMMLSGSLCYLSISIFTLLLLICSACNNLNGGFGMLILTKNNICPGPITTMYSTAPPLLPLPHSSSLPLLPSSHLLSDPEERKKIKKGRDRTRRDKDSLLPSRALSPRRQHFFVVPLRLSYCLLRRRPVKLSYDSFLQRFPHTHTERQRGTEKERKYRNNEVSLSLRPEVAEAQPFYHSFSSLPVSFFCFVSIHLHSPPTSPRSPSKTENEGEGAQTDPVWKGRSSLISFSCAPAAGVVCSFRGVAIPSYWSSDAKP